MTEWIGTTFQSEVGWSHLETLVNVGDRMAGSSGERKAAEETLTLLDDIGLRNVHFDEFSIQGWERESSRLDIGGTTQPCIALPRSPEGSVSGELIDLGYGLPADFAEVDVSGKIVMAASNVPAWYDRFIHRREKYYEAVSAGASGFIFRNHVEGCLAPTGSVGTAEDPIGDIPAIGVSKEVGKRLGRRWEGEEATIDIEATIEPATSQNIHAEIGPETDEAILVTSHIDAHDISEGAGDNGAGTATLVEIAQALIRGNFDLDTQINFIVYGAEEVGLCGSSHDRDTRSKESIKAILNNDGVGRGRTLRCYTHGFPELSEAAETVANKLSHPVTTTPRLGPHSDHWPYVQRGVPGYHMLSETDHEGRGWGHTRADTLDKVDIRNIREQAIVLTELVAYIASDTCEIAHRSQESIANQLEEEDLAYGMKQIGDWPYTNF